MLFLLKDSSMYMSGVILCPVLYVFMGMLDFHIFLTILIGLFADPHDSETFRPLDMHHGMEVRLGLSKGPVCPSFI